KQFFRSDLISFVFYSFKHQQQVATAVERAKQLSMTELNAIISQQMHAQQLPPHAAAAAAAHGPLPLMPHPLAGVPMTDRYVSNPILFLNI
ncbi:groucho-like protein, partial [Sarcoptes scabiei]